MKKALLFSVFILAMTIESWSQCSMCSAVAETAQKNGSDMVEGVNAGILYLMGIPYALLLGVGVLLFRRLNRNRAETE
ncbi:MAG: hypothetical protein R2813_01845 [Flavobacteriales bacterium]